MIILFLFCLKNKQKELVPSNYFRWLPYT